MTLDLVGAGMVTPVGYTGPSTCAAIRAGIDCFAATRFMFDGEWLRGGAVSYPGEPRGRRKLLMMALSAIDECLQAAQPATAGDVALALCLPELERPGRLPGLDASFEAELQANLAPRQRLGPMRRLELEGSMGALTALQWAAGVLARGEATYCVVVGVDSLLVGDTLADFHAQRRLLTSENSDGFLPGEAAAAILLSARARSSEPALRCLGLGVGQELATLDSELPLRADGLVQAYRAAFESSGCTYEDVDYRITDICGEQYDFKAAALAMARTMRVRKPVFELWHPGDCVGRVGAASIPLVLGVALAAARKGYAPGPGVLCHFSDDVGRRAAMILRVHNQ